MEHRHVEELSRIADVPVETKLAIARPVLTTQKERMEYWAGVLRNDPERPLNSLPNIEFVPCRARPSLRMDGSAVEVAFHDPVLRANGLRSDTLGAAREFFGLSEYQLHQLVCSCANGPVSPSSRIAIKVLREVEFTFVRRSAAFFWCGLLGVVLLEGLFFLP